MLYLNKKKKFKCILHGVCPKWLKNAFIFIQYIHIWCMLLVHLRVYDHKIDNKKFASLSLT